MRSSAFNLSVAFRPNPFQTATVKCDSDISSRCRLSSVDWPQSGAQPCSNRGGDSWVWLLSLFSAKPHLLPPTQACVTQPRCSADSRCGSVLNVCIIRRFGLMLNSVTALLRMRMFSAMVTSGGVLNT